MSRKRVYLESSVISYLTAKPSNDILKLSKQRVTKTWWKNRERYDLYISEVVLEEIGLGDEFAALARLEAVVGIELLSRSVAVNELTRMLLIGNAVPERSREDAFHIAIAAIHKVDYLLTWNQKHIANTQKREQINNAIRGFGLVPPLILTPEEFLEMESCDRETD